MIKNLVDHQFSLSRAKREQQATHNQRANGFHNSLGLSGCLFVQPRAGFFALFSETKGLAGDRFKGDGLHGDWRTMSDFGICRKPVRIFSSSRLEYDAPPEPRAPSTDPLAGRRGTFDKTAAKGIIGEEHAPSVFDQRPLCPFDTKTITRF
jgi:hypothetical protein